MRLPPEHIQILLPVWGQRYTRDFLELCLPSLLAPGNVPGLSQLGHCTFVLLAPAGDAEVIQRSQLWKVLLDCCSVRVRYIDDLISQSSSTVLTLAYTSAIREAGEQALDTCFIPLVADYILSDGSLLAVVKRIFAGADAVLAGNFQIVREAAVSGIEKSKSEAGILTIPSRVLVGLALNTLHPKTLAEIVNQGQALRPETNRLFWRVDDHCMIGRFFLMHMIAIRPETSDFIIAAPSDYSLVPELCPSGNIVRITDSDDYFVVECQPQSWDAGRGASGDIALRSFAKGLGDWATAMHRENARSAVIFHTEAPSPDLAQTIAASEVFISKVEASRSCAPLPFRNHPVWRPALDYHLTTARTEQDPARLASITGDSSLATERDRASRLRLILLGRAPYFRPWHPRWADVRMLKQSMAATSGNVAIVSDASARVRTWLDGILIEREGQSATHIRLSDIPEAVERGEQPDAQFDSLFLISDRATGFANVLPRLTSLLRTSGTLVLGIGPVFSETEHELTPISVPDELAVIDCSLSWKKATCVTVGASRAAIQTAMMQYARKSVRLGIFRGFFWFAAAGGLAAISMFSNVTAGRKMLPKRSRLSSLFLTFCKTEN